MRTLHKQKPAFTILELVMVIVVLGILASLAMPRMDRDLRQEAADNIISAIRHTQHLALVDDKTNPFDTTWQSELWKITFSDSNYTISSGNNFSIDPINAKPIDGKATGSPESRIGKKYGVSGITSVGCGLTIGFDNLGRPHNGVSANNTYDNYMSSDCNLTIRFSQSDVDDLHIDISRETGVASSD